MVNYLSNYFPPHRLRIELFFGAGGSFFYLPRPEYSILNDYDDEVTNLFLVVKNQKDQFIKEIKRLPVSESLLKYWKHNTEQDPIIKAIRFVLMSNFTYMGKGDTIRFGIDNTKKELLNNVETTFSMLENTQIMNRDFREVLPAISFSETVTSKSKSFVYMDPVYLDTEHYYRVPKWRLSDSCDCLDIMVNSGIRCAMSEFDHPDIIREAKKRGLFIEHLKTRRNIKNYRVEILITNYQYHLKLL